MLTEPLPTTLDVRKAAAREVAVSGVVELTSLPRLCSALASENGHIEARCEFGRDEENRFLVAVEVNAELEVRCQRCLEAMPITLRSDSRLAIVGDDEAAKQLPAELDPWVVEGESGDLWALVEDELILEIPIFAAHDVGDCKQLMDEYRQEPEDPADDADNPFKVLEQLKAGTSQQET